MTLHKHRWVFPLFFPDSDDRLSLNFHRFVYKLWYTKCGSLDNTVLSMMCYCLKESLLQRKMSNWVLRFTTFQIDMKIVEFFWGWGRVSIYNGVKGHYVWCPSTSFMFHSICCFLGHDDVIGAVVSGGMLWRNNTHFKVQEYNLRVSLFSWC